MTEDLLRSKAIGAPGQNVQAAQIVQAPTLRQAQGRLSVLPRDAGEDKGGGLNDWNFLNELNACRGADHGSSGERASQLL